jgi:hypothetical protein
MLWQMLSSLWVCLSPWASPIIKHQANLIYLNIPDQGVVRGGGFLHLLHKCESEPMPAYTYRCKTPSLFYDGYLMDIKCPLIILRIFFICVMRV